MSSDTVRLSIDGQSIQAPKGKTILQAALDNGIYIPHLCDQENLRHTANCRLCMVKVEGREGIDAACATPIEEGMVVNVNDEMADRVRKLSVDLMFKTHPNECTGCPKYGRCQLQSISQVVGDTGRALRSNPIRLPADDKNPIVLHEMYRCILCGRCVRACNEMRGVGAINFEKVNGRMQVKVCGESLADADCRFCGACIEVCPTGAIREQEALAKKMEGKKREDALVPCQYNCPAHIDVPGYLRDIREDNCPAAVARIRERVTFPHALGYICNHKCETDCRRGSLNEAISIRDLKRYAAERDDGSWRGKGFQKPATGKKVAVIGAGPAGLTAAYYLQKLGHAVTVFEELEKPGGMMQYGIPSYRLPREVVAAEVREITAVGVEIKTGQKVTQPAKLLDDGYSAVLVAVGAHSGVRLPLPGNDLEGVYTNIDFLRAAAQGNPLPVGDNVVVLGGGNVALDCAGVAKRLGAKTVRAACLEAADCMTSTDEEFDWAIEDGLIMLNQKTFLEIIGQDGHVVGMKVAGINSFSFDSEGKAVLDMVEGSEEILVADTVIFATGQRPALDLGYGLELGRGNRVQAGPDGATSVPGVFAAGDAVTGTDSVVRAIAGGREAASGIDKFLGGDGVIDEQLAPVQSADPVIGPAKDGFASRARQATDVLPAEERLCGFIPFDKGFDDAHSACEADRCLQCDLRLQIAPQKFWSDYEAGKGEVTGG